MGDKSSLRVVSRSKSASTYHFVGCKHLEGKDMRGYMILSKAKVESLGYRPCKDCNKMSFRYEREQQSAENLAKSKGMQIWKEGDTIYIRSLIGGWKLTYLEQKQKFRLYHCNRTAEYIDFSNMDKERYHGQKDIKTTYTIGEALQYIYEHDRFKIALKETGGTMQGYEFKKQNYKKAYENKKRNNAINRVDRLFRQLEDNDKSLKEASYN